MKRLRIVIVGCGRMGSQHADAASRLGHRIAIACDVDGARASALAGKYPGCCALSEPAAILWSAVDAGFVCTPPHARGPVELAAALHGVPLFLEKPVGLSAKQCRPALAAFKARRTITSVGYMNRYRSSVQRVRQLLAEETALGFLAHWIGAPYRVSWWADPALSGGQLNEQCTHLIDLARYLVAEIVEVTAWAQPMPERPQSTAAVSVHLRFATGALGTVLCGCLAEEKQIGCRIFTRRGLLSLDGWDFRLGGASGVADPLPPASTNDVFTDEASVFLAAVQSGDARGIHSDLGDALQTQQVVDAATATLAAARPRPIEGRRAVVR